MIYIYRYLFFLLLPFIWLVLLWRLKSGKEDKSKIKERFGFSSLDRPAGKLVWLHAASAGESLMAITFVKYLQKLLPEINILITTYTVVGARLVENKIKELSSIIKKSPTIMHQMMPIDHIVYVRRFLKYWTPDAVFIFESERWPNFMYELKNIPFYILNGTFSEKSFKRWKFLKNTLKTLLKSANLIMTKSEVDADRFKFFSDKNVVCVGNLKYENSPLLVNNELSNIIIEKLGKRQGIFVAASTHFPEEEQILDVHKQLRGKYDIVTFIAPRHINRISEILEVAKKKGMKCILFSQFINTQDITNFDLCLIDSFGQLGTFFSLADVAFIGGSLVPIGGHNIYEPVALGCPVIHGSFMHTCLDMCAYLKDNEVSFQVENSEKLEQLLLNLFSNHSVLDNVRNNIKLLQQRSVFTEIEKYLNFSDLYDAT